MTIQDRIYQIMDNKKMKQCLVAKAAGYDTKIFNALLRGRKKITDADIIPICKALEVTPNELFGIPESKAKNKSAS